MTPAELALAGAGCALYVAGWSFTAAVEHDRIESDPWDLIASGGDVRPFAKGAVWPLTWLVWLGRSLARWP